MNKTLKQVHQVISLHHLWKACSHYYEVLSTCTDYSHARVKMQEHAKDSLTEKDDWVIVSTSNDLVHIKTKDDNEEIIFTVQTNTIE